MSIYSLGTSFWLLFSLFQLFSRAKPKENLKKKNSFYIESKVEFSGELEQDLMS